MSPPTWAWMFRHHMIIRVRKPAAARRPRAIVAPEASFLLFTTAAG